MTKKNTFLLLTAVCKAISLVGIVLVVLMPSYNIPIIPAEIIGLLTLTAFWMSKRLTIFSNEREINKKIKACEGKLDDTGIPMNRIAANENTALLSNNKNLETLRKSQYSYKLTWRTLATIRGITGLLASTFAAFDKENFVKIFGTTATGLVYMESLFEGLSIKRELEYLESLSLTSSDHQQKMLSLGTKLSLAFTLIGTSVVATLVGVKLTNDDLYEYYMLPTSIMLTLLSSFYASRTYNNSLRLKSPDSSNDSAAKTSYVSTYIKLSATLRGTAGTAATVLSFVPNVPGLAFKIAGASLLMANFLETEAEIYKLNCKIKAHNKPSKKKVVPQAYFNTHKLVTIEVQNDDGSSGNCEPPSDYISESASMTV